MDEFFKSLICGTFAGIANCISGFPLDTIKVRMQMESVGLLQCIYSTYKEGPLTFFKGVYYPLVTIPIVNAVSFSSYELYKRLSNCQELSFRNGIEAGAFSGIIGSLIVNPVELVKCRMQADHGKFKNSAECLHKIVRESGVRELYRGMFSTLMRELPSMGGQFAAYEYSKSFLLNRRRATALSMGQSFLTGGIAGIGAWIFAYPQDIVKTRLQVRTVIYAKSKWLPDGGFISCWKNIYQKEGIKGFTTGITPCMMRAFIANGFMIVGYEWTQQCVGAYFSSIH